MALFNTTTPLGLILNNTGQYILGDYTLLGVWLIILLIGVGLAFRIDFNLLLVIVMPLTVVFMAYGLMAPVIGGIIIILVAFILGANFLFNKR